MIAEIPALQCVSASSPFLAGIKTVRRAFATVENRFGSWARALSRAVSSFRKG
jgi:hypothetical protein